MKVERGPVGGEDLAEDAMAKRSRVAAAPPGARRTGGGGAVGRRGGERGRRGGERRRRVQADAAAVQRLFHTCRALFRGPGTVPGPHEVHALCAMIDGMKPEDFGLSPDHKFFRARGAAEGTPLITQTTIYKCPNFSMVIFFLPPNGVIPLHNHPGMTVFSKLLVGSMHIKSYDWVDPNPEASASSNSSPSSSSSSGDQLRLAKLVVDQVFTAPCDTSVLYPTTGGNMHRFTAVTPCAVLDILGPPYSIEEDRDCTYYTDIPYTNASTTADDSRGDPPTGADDEQDDHAGRRLAWLKEIEMPRELRMFSVQYGGPPISDS